MSVLKNIFKNKPAFIGFHTAGDGGVDFSLDVMLALVKGGVDILEVAVPFTDPVADGPTIQASHARAGEKINNMQAVFKLIQAFKKQSSVPVVLFSYFNPIFAYSMPKFFEQAAAVGVDAVLIVDLPMEESDEYRALAKKNNIDPIFLLSPSTSKERIEKIAKLGSGFLYYVCRKGTTGVKDDLPEDFVDKIKEIKSMTHLPVVAGFGIADKKMAKKVIAYADGFVSASVFIDAVGKGANPDELRKLAESIDPRNET